MSADAAVAEFAAAAEDLDIEWSRGAAADVPALVADAVEEPAVGVQPNVLDVDLTGVTEVTLDPTSAEIDAARTGVTGAVLGIAEYGSIVIKGNGPGSEPVSLFVDRHVAILPVSTLVEDMPAAIDRMGELATEGADLVIATGPSATADMGELVLGAHGPATVHVIIVEDR